MSLSPGAQTWPPEVAPEAEFQNRAIVRSTTVDGDAFVLVGMACCSRGAVRVRGSPVSSLGPGVAAGGGGFRSWPEVSFDSMYLCLRRYVETQVPNLLV